MAHVGQEINHNTLLEKSALSAIPHESFKKKNITAMKQK